VTVARLAAVVAGALGTALAAAAAAPSSTSLVSYRLVGLGKPLPAQIGSGPCRQGRTSFVIAGSSGRRVGTAHLCVLTIAKVEDSRGVLRRIVQTVREIDSLPTGAIVSRQRQVFTFSRDGRRSSAGFRGRVAGGTGRYARARGTLSGGGPTVDGVANWRITVRLRIGK
jgi:hypothetical protein